MSFPFRLPRPSGALVVALSPVAALDILFAGMAVLLAASYVMTASYGLTIVGLSFMITTALSPLAVWGWRSQVTRAELEPELAELRRRHAGDRQRLASDTAALFKDHGSSPWTGCLPSLVPAAVYLSAYEVIRGLTHRVSGSALLHPRYLPHGSLLFHSLVSSTSMSFWGVDLARTGAAALQLSPPAAGLYLALVVITVGAGVWQQHLVRSALPRPGGPTPVAAQRVVTFLPALIAVWGLALPLAVTLYYASTSIARLVQQWIVVSGHL
ncbi:MAG: YidC/Oxa1 family membrane protein insertase [Pseudonocardiaceae bacterium]